MAHGRFTKPLLRRGTGTALLTPLRRFLRLPNTITGGQVDLPGGEGQGFGNAAAGGVQLPQKVRTSRGA
jgi:hypothetical protein